MWRLPIDQCMEKRDLVLTSLLCLSFLIFGPASVSQAAETPPTSFFQKHCYQCHDRETQESNLDLSTLRFDLQNADNFARWKKIFDRIEAGEMPPRNCPRPDSAEIVNTLSSLKIALIEAEKSAPEDKRRTLIRRLTRSEYENTIRDLFDMPGIALQGNLPVDGSAHGFDKNSDALDISHVNLAKYVEAAEHTLNLAIATQPTPPKVQKRRISLANNGGFVAHVLMNGDGVLLKNKQPDPEFPPAADQSHIDEGAHARLGLFRNGSSVGLFRHEDESLSPYFIEHVTIYPGRYRVRTSLWAFQWDKGRVLPARGTEAARLSVVQLTGDGRGGQHPSYVLGYFDAPSMESKEHELVTWLNHNEIIGFNTASLAPVANYSRKGRAMAFTGPGIACDWLDIEGPLHEVWPPHSHRVLFGDLPLVELKPEASSTVRPPQRKVVRQIGAGLNRPDPPAGLWTVHSEQPLQDADRLMAHFLTKAFRRPVDASIRQAYVKQVAARLNAGDCFETAMRWAYRAALCSPDFLFHIENPELQAESKTPNEKERRADAPVNGAGSIAGPSSNFQQVFRSRVDADSLACRLSYLLWNSLPDEQLTKLAREGQLHRPDILSGEIERLLKDPKSERFVEDFVGQWLKLRQIAATDPDRKLYPEFSPYLQDSMTAETRAYFRELLEQNLDATHLVRSDFAMLNEKLATHYGISGVSGCRIRRVALPANNPRGPFLTQASILKITANGTTTSPVPRGAFVMARLLGQEPDPPPPNIPAIEPDVRGAKTIREQLDKHKSDAVCASCHAKLDPPGFALESFDVIGGWRDRYRSIGEGDAAPRGSIDPFIGISFKLGPKVDPSGLLPDQRPFQDVVEFQKLLASDGERLLKNMAQQLAIYATGRDLMFSDRDSISAIVTETRKQGGGIRTLLHQLIQSDLFRSK